MPSPAGKLTVLKTALSRERRTNRRLRVLIKEMQDELTAMRGEIEIQTKRLAQVQAEVDLLKPKHSPPA
jgi:uncharacterized protein HemX